MITKNYTSSEIGSIGEKAAVDWLRNNGFTVSNWNTQGAGSTDIEACIKQLNGVLKPALLVQVKTAIFPNSPVSVSLAELQKITTRANNLCVEAWEAKVQLGQSFAGLFRTGEIQWRKLN